MKRLQYFKCLLSNKTLYSQIFVFFTESNSSSSYITTTSSIALPTSQLILQPFHCFTYITAYSPTLPLLYLHHSSFSNPSIASPTSQLILQPFRHFTYVTGHSPTLLSLLLPHRTFTYVTWRAAHE